jgi:hypothetical protein
MTKEKTMLYVKNVPGWERVLRVAVGAAAVSVTTLGGWAGWLAGASAAGLVMSGLFGFCPACALVGRRLDAGR